MLKTSTLEDRTSWSFSPGKSSPGLIKLLRRGRIQLKTIMRAAQNFGVQEVEGEDVFTRSIVNDKR